MRAWWRDERWWSQGHGGTEAFGLVFTLLHGHTSVHEDAAGDHHTGRAGRGKTGQKSQSRRCQPHPHSLSLASSMASPQQELEGLQGSPEPLVWGGFGVKAFCGLWRRVAPRAMLSSRCTWALRTLGCPSLEV